MSFPEQGFLYIATSESKPRDFHDLERAMGYEKISYLEEAVISARSLKKAEPNAHITLVTNYPIQDACFDKVIVQPWIGKDWFDGLHYKVKYMYECSPYKKTCFLDTDTYVVGSCSGVFSLLNYYDLCLAPEPPDDREIDFNGIQLEGHYMYNSGVIYFKKNEENHSLFSRWLALYEEKMLRGRPMGDQKYLMRALLESKARFYVLAHNWNARAHHYISLKGAVRIIHARFKSYKDISVKINESMDQRYWDPIARRCYWFRRSPLTLRFWREFYWDKYMKIVNKTPKILKEKIRYFLKAVKSEDGR